MSSHEVDLAESPHSLHRQTTPPHLQGSTPNFRDDSNWSLDSEPLPVHDSRVRDIHDAAYNAEFAKAYELLRNLERSTGLSARKVLGTELWERITRIGDIFELSLLEFDTEVHEWTPLIKKPKSGSVHFRFSNSMLKILSTIEITVTSKIDIIKAFVGLCEYDLSAKYDSTHVLCQRLWPKSAGPQMSSQQTTSSCSTLLGSDTLWRICRNSHTGGSKTVTKEDNIFHVSVIDALEHPLGALVLAVYSPRQPTVVPGEMTAELTELFGQALPKVPESTLRVGDESTIFTLRPVKGSNPVAFELKSLFSTRLSKAAHMFPGVVASDLHHALSRFEQFAAEDSELRWLMLFSPQHELYDRIRMHLMKTNRDMIWSVPDSISSFVEISAHIPEDWSDFNENDALQKPRYQAEDM